MTSSIDNKSTRYVAGGVTEQFPTRLGWWERTIMPYQNDDILITIDTKYAGRPDLIADLVYGSAIYSWVVLQYNTILDLEVELKAGVTIRLPTIDRLI